MTLHFRCRICSEVLDVERRETCSNACAQALRAHRRPRSERRASRRPANDFPQFMRAVRRGTYPPGGYPPSGSPGDRRGGLRQVRRPMNLNGWTVSDGSAT